MDTTQIMFIATLRASMPLKQNAISTLFFSISKNAKKLGGNCFKLNAYEIDKSTKQIVLTLDIFFAEDAILNMNFNKHVKNRIFVFGGEIASRNEMTRCKINDQEITILSGHYFEQVVEEGKQIKINKGGATGMTMWITCKQEEPASFLSLNGFNFGGGGVPPMGNLGTSFNTGRINPIDGNLGYLLIQILEKQK